MSVRPPIPPVPIAQPNGHVSPEWWRWFNELFTDSSANEVLTAGLFGAEPAQEGWAPDGAMPADPLSPQIALTGYSDPALPPFATLSEPIRGGAIGVISAAAARPGEIGEYRESVVAAGSSVALTSAATASIATLSFSPGDWDVWGHVHFTGDNTTTVNYLAGSVSSAAAVLDSTPGRQASMLYGGVAIFASLNPVGFACGRTRLAVTTATPLYLTAQAGFGVAGCSAFGTIAARRRR